MGVLRFPSPKFVTTFLRVWVKRGFNSFVFLVVLAPFGLEAKLTGGVFRSPHEPTVKKLMEEWAPFYPLANLEDLTQVS